MILSLPTGNVIHISMFEFLFLVPEDKVDEFYQQLIADNAGIPAPEDPFSNRASKAKVDWEEVPEVVEEAVHNESDWEDDIS